MAIPYVHERKQFGQADRRVPVVQGKLADMYTTMNAARAYVYAVAAACDRGQRTRKDAAGCVLFAAEKATQMALDALQLLGGNGYINDYPTGRLLRDAKLYENRCRHQRNPPLADRPRDHGGGAVMFPSATSAECLGQVIGWLGNDLVRVAPQNLALARRRDRTHRQTALLDQPGAIARPADRFLGVRMEPADCPDGVTALEMRPTNPTWNGQMLVEPVELMTLQFVMNPIRAAVPVQVPGRVEEAGLHRLFGWISGVTNRKLHFDTHRASKRGVPLAQIRDVKSRPPAASGHSRRETSGEMQKHAFHRRL